jgi:hypothetical protein
VKFVKSEKMKSKYVANTFDSTITPYYIAKETRSTVTVSDGSREWKEMKQSLGLSWHDTYVEAKMHLLETSNKQIEFYQMCLQKEVEKLTKVISL